MAESVGLIRLFTLAGPARRVDHLRDNGGDLPQRPSTMLGIRSTRSERCPMSWKAPMKAAVLHAAAKQPMTIEDIAISKLRRGEVRSVFVFDP